MNKSTHLQVASPEAYISINKNRVRQKNGIVYLENNTEFEIEFYNKTSDIQKAVITINGKIQRDALVVRPGEHFYLDRFMDEKRRLKFDTYFVDDVKEVREAIRNNGEIKIEFYKQQPYYSPYISYTTTTPWYQNWYNTGGFNNNTISYRSAMGGGGRSPSIGNMSLGATLNAKTSNAENVSFTCDAMAQCSDQAAEPAKMETGRVEAGQNSDQNFTPVYYNFEAFANTTITFKLYPVSKRGDIRTTDEVRNYCPDCGRRVKRGYQYCPSCGTRV